MEILDNGTYVNEAQASICLSFEISARMSFEARV